jgi:hypothetical protein
MRDDLRRTCHQIWVIDCSPEGHQPDVATRIFQAVQQPVCIVLAARALNKDREVPARVLFHVLPAGRREEKFAALANLSLVGTQWTECPPGWRDPFLPAAIGAWASFATLNDLFLYDGSGVMPGRTWAISPDPETLEKRWARLVKETNPTEKERLFHPQLRNGKVASRHIRKIVKEDLGSKATRPVSILEDKGGVWGKIDRLQRQILHGGKTRTHDNRYKFNGADAAKIVEWIETTLRDFNGRLEPAEWRDWLTPAPQQAAQKVDPLVWQGDTTTTSSFIEIGPFKPGDLSKVHFIIKPPEGDQ